MKFILSLLLLIGMSSIYASEPAVDYGFTCNATDTKTNSTLELQGGVDPSGGFSIYITSTNIWRGLNGAMYIADRIPTKNSTKYASVPYEKPQITLTIYWNKKQSSKTYLGQIKVKGENSNSTIPVACNVE